MEVRVAVVGWPTSTGSPQGLLTSNEGFLWKFNDGASEVSMLDYQNHHLCGFLLYRPTENLEVTCTNDGFGS